MNEPRSRVHPSARAPPRGRAVAEWLLQRHRGGDLQPKSIDGDLTIPESLAQPIELEHDGKDVSFRLIGASAGVEAEADGAEATFDGVFSGVNATYVARPFGVKETLELTSASSPRVFKIDEAKASGEQVRAVNKANGNPATRYIHPTTGQSVVVDDTTGQVIHVGGPGFKYGPESGDLP